MTKWNDIIDVHRSQRWEVAHHMYVYMGCMHILYIYGVNTTSGSNVTEVGRNQRVKRLWVKKTVSIFLLYELWCFLSFSLILDHGRSTKRRCDIHAIGFHSQTNTSAFTTRPQQCKINGYQDWTDLYPQTWKWIAPNKVDVKADFLLYCSVINWTPPRFF